MMNRNEIINILNQSGTVCDDPVLIVVPDHARRPCFSASEASWSDVPALCRHRGRQASARSLKKRTLVSRWGGSEPVQGTKAGRIVQNPLQQPKQQPQQSTPASATTNSSKPRRKASIEFSTQAVEKFQRSRNLCMPMRKASIDMAIPCQPQSTNLRQPMRKASVDMNFNVTSKLESWSQTFHDEGAPPTGRLSRPGCYRYMNNEGTEEGHSSSESSRDGDGCMIDLIRPKSITREVVRDIEEKIQMQNAEGSYEEEIGENSDNGGCMLDQDVRSMPRRSKWNQHEGELKQQDYGYQEHHPTPRLYDDCCYQTEVLCDAEGNESIASDCMINMVRSRAQHLQLVVTATGRPQRKASIDMCGNGSSMIDVIGLQAGQGSNWNRTPDRRTSLAMISVEEAKRHIANGTAREVQ